MGRLAAPSHAETGSASETIRFVVTEVLPRVHDLPKDLIFHRYIAKSKARTLHPAREPVGALDLLKPVHDELVLVV
jgi:hypothetical protein